MRTAVMLLVVVLVSGACASGEEASPATSGPRVGERSVEEAGGGDRPPVADDVARAVDEAVDAYLADSTTDQALALIEVIRDGGAVDHGPFLLDLLRTTGSSLVRTAAIEALSEISGIPTAVDANLAYVELGGWVLDSRPQPGDRYRAFKVAVYGAIDPPFGPLLDQVDDVQLLVGLQWGGVPVGGIVQLDDPVRIPPGEASWANGDEVVYAVDVGDEVVVYPRRVIGRHELSNDTALAADGGALPFGVSYCSLCRTAVAFDRRVGTEVLTFRTSGLLVDANKVMVDDQTGSLWRQATGEALAGPLEGEQLDLLAVRALTFDDVADGDRHRIVDLPAPFILDPETGTLTTYAYLDEAPLPDYVAGGRLWFPVASVGSEPDPLTEVLGIEVGGASLAVEAGAATEAGPAVVAVGAASILIVPGPTGIRFFDVSGDTGRWVDPDGDPTESWSAVRDGLDEAELPLEREVLGRPEAWFSWLARHPETDRWPA